MYAKICKGLLVSLLGLSSLTLANQFDQQAQQQLSIPYVDLPVTIDGELDDEIWRHAKVIMLDTVTSPYDNTPSPVKTEARIVDNGKELILSFIADDPNPEQIIASIGERDTKWFDDVVGIKIDTLNNRRITYSFFVNPYGVQNDETYNEITDQLNELWDGIWQSFGKVTQTGYQVEMAIPYHILNFDESQTIKQWPFELVRVYPRDKRLRLSNIKLDRDNACWVCQYPMAQGFEQAKIGSNIQLTPALVASYEESRDLFSETPVWQDDTSVEPSLDLRWGINPKTLFNATINPDFSTVEADAGQLSVNKKFSLFYDEKRAFFLENNNFFEGITNLVYTRNIADPDYGVKITGSQDAHNYGAFISHDAETNFILSGNLSAQIASLNTESHSAAFRYLYDVNQDMTIGLTSTLRKADDYHNYVAGVDGSYRLDGANLFAAQALVSNTEYPDELFNDFCWGDCNQLPERCEFGDCAFNEQVLRAKKDGDFSGNSYKLGYYHQSEYWQITAERSSFSDDFRADLGFVNRIDYLDDSINIKRTFYQDTDALWSTFELGGKYSIQHNDNGELINRDNTLYFYADGPMLSRVELSLIDADKTGLRVDGSLLAILGNTQRFNEQQLHLFAQIRPTNTTYYSIDSTIGDKIDYDNNRLGETFEITGNFTWHPNQHLEIDIYHTYSRLDADSLSGTNDEVFTANLTDARIRYYFDVASSIKLSMVYQDIAYNPENNPYYFFSETERSLATQLIYSYKVNPQTVFFLGYSDNSFEDDYLGKLKQSQRTIFSKISYAWR
ncbi:carbohydrate binding family 9 domain-containing protein [Colwellia sp. MEBiC06753]